MKVLATLLAAALLACVSHGAESEQTRTGKVGLKALTAAESVVAVLYVDETPLELTATGETAAKLEELAKRGAHASVSGTAKEKVFEVTKVVEVAADGNAGKEKKNNGKKAGKKKKKKEAGAAQDADPAQDKPATMEAENM